MASKVPGVGADFDPEAMCAQLIVNLNAGQDVPAAVSMAEAKAKAKAKPGLPGIPTKAGLRDQSGLKKGVGGGVTDLEKMTLLALIVGMMDKSAKTGIDIGEVKRRLMALKAAKSKLTPYFDEASKTLDVTDMKSAMKQQSQRLKQEQAKLEKTAGISGFGLQKYQKLSPRNLTAMTLSTMYVQVSEDPSVGIDQACAAINQLGASTADTRTMTVDALDESLKQVIMFVKNMSDAKAQKMQSLAHT